MSFYDIIEKKKNGVELSSEEIAVFVKGAATSEIPDYQLSALLMAIAIKGMSERETYDLTMEMANSGDILSFPFDTVDKHSTGGVGDSTTFVVAAVAATLGFKVFKMSGRGLGLSGGTLDKLESIKGFDSNIDFNTALKQTQEIGLTIVGQSGDVCPADKKLYALRDVTATVDSIPLIAASVMSKKIAGGAKSLVLDVKCGKGAFIKTKTDAITLAQTMLNIAKRAGIDGHAVITDMDMPLARAVGNSVEIFAAIEVLQGKVNNLAYVSKTLLKTLLGDKLADCENKIEQVLNDGSALNKFKQFVKAQGGDISYIEEPAKLCLSPYKFELYAQNSGYISDIDALKIAKAVHFIGGGRDKKEDAIDPYVGVVLEKEYGEFIEENTLLATLYYSNYSHMLLANDIAQAITISDKKPPKKDIVISVIGDK